MIKLQTNGAVVLRPRQISLWLAAGAVLLAIISQIASVIKHTIVLQPDFTQRRIALGIIERLEANSEIAIATWYASFLLLLCAGLVFVIVLHERQTGSPTWKQWGLLSALFLLLTIDESASLHEMVGNYLYEQYSTGGLLRFAWIVPGAALVVAMTVFFWRFFGALPDRLWRWFLLGAVVYFGGAVGMEAIGGYYSSTVGEDNMVYELLTNIEELLEMLGAVTFVHAILSYMRQRVHLSLAIR